VSTTARQLSGGRRLVLSCLPGLGLAGFMVAMVLPAIDRRHQYAALGSRGVTTAARIGYCATAQNSRPVSVTVTCPGAFTVLGTRVTEDILGLPAPLQAGATLVVMAGPQDTPRCLPADRRADRLPAGMAERRQLLRPVGPRAAHPHRGQRGHRDPPPSPGLAGPVPPR